MSLVGLIGTRERILQAGASEEEKGSCKPEHQKKRKDLASRSIRRRERILQVGASEEEKGSCKLEHLTLVGDVDLRVIGGLVLLIGTRERILQAGASCNILVFAMMGTRV